MNNEKWKQIKWNELWYRLIYSLLLFGMVLFAAGNICGVQKPGLLHLLVGFAVLGVLLLFGYGRMRGKLLGITGIGAAFLAAVVLSSPARMLQFLHFYYNWAAGGSVFRGEQLLLYELLQCVWMAVFSYAAQVFFERFPAVRYLAGVLLGFVLIYCMFRHLSITHMGTTLILWYEMLNYVEWTKSRWKKEKSRDTKSYMLWIMPFCILYLFCLSLLPSFQKPCEWKMVQRAYQGAREVVTACVENILRGNEEDFQVDFAGFSETGGIHGKLLDTRQQVMTIQGTDTLKGNVYLVGKIYDHFDGKSWSENNSEYPEERSLDALETLYALRRYEGDQQELALEAPLTVQYRYFQSGCLFTPEKTVSLDCDRKYKEGTNICFQKKQSYGTRYQLSFFQLNLKNPLFDEYLEQEMPDNQKVWSTLERKYAKGRLKDLSRKKMQEHSRWIQENDISDVRLSAETAEYLAAITKEQDSKMGKLRAIERELSSYTYTVNPGAIPSEIQDEGEFLDYFLKSKKGYCSHFATAFVLLARAEGIPARYVEGFCISVKPGQETAVYSGDAHAWPEVYIEGFGWIPFEPTPGYSEFRYHAWQTNHKWDRTYGKEYSYIPEQKAAEKRQMPEKTHAENGAARRVLQIAGIMLAAVLGAVLIIFAVDRILFFVRYRRMSLEERFVIEIRKNIRLLSKLKIERNDAETLEELKQRAEKRLPQVSFSFLELYESYLYGRKPVVEDMQRCVLLEQKQILEAVKQERKVYYYWIRLIGT